MAHSCCWNWAFFVVDMGILIPLHHGVILLVLLCTIALLCLPSHT
jgi:hypothetical protein